MNEQSLAAKPTAAPAARKRRRWKEIVSASGLPAEVSAVITTVIKRARLWRSEASDVALELVAHFQDGLDAGRTTGELTASFGNPQQTAKLIRRGKARCRPLWWQAWWWCSRGLLVLLGVYLLLVLWQLWAKPEIKVNYLDIINRPALAVPEADRAWPYYRDACLELGLHSYSKDNYKDDPEHLRNLLDDSWRPGNKEWPALVAWLEKHRPALEKIRQGASKPAYGLPVWTDENKYGLQDRLALDVGDPQIPPHELQDWGNLVLTPLSHVDLNQKLANILSGDAIRASQTGDAATALADIEALMGLSRQTQETPFLVSGLVGLRFDSIALQTAAEILYHKPDLWSAEQLQQLAHRAAAQQFHPETWLQYEQYLFLDAVQRVYTDNGNEDGRITLDGLERISEIAWLVKEKNATKDFQKPWQLLSLPALNMVQATRKESIEHYQQILNKELALLQQPYWQCVDQLEEIEQKFRDPNEKLRYPLSSLLFPAVRAARIALTSHQGRKEGLLFGIALELYHREHGVWPEKLEQLAPRYMPTLPVDQLTGKPLHYRLIEGKPCVYSVGQNLQVDGGLLYQPSDETGYREGYYDQGLSDTVVDAAGDWILWSLVPEHQRSLPPEPEKQEDGLPKP